MSVFPSILTTYTNPQATDKLNSPSHSGVETAQNSGLQQVEAVIGVEGAASTVGSLQYLIKSSASDGGGHVQVANKGGTGQTSFVKGDLLVGASSSVLSKLAVGTDGYAIVADSTQSTGLGYSAVSFFPGFVTMYGASVAPTGWLNCDGLPYPISSYTSLYNVIGSVYGGNPNSSVFQVPNFSARIPIGIGSTLGGGITGRGSVAGGAVLSSIVTGLWKGEETHTLIAAELAQHTHNVTISATDSGNTANTIGKGNTSNSTNATFASSVAGADQPHNNVQPVMGINFIIKF